MFYPSFSIESLTSEAMTVLGMRTGQWVHDLISRGRLYRRSGKFQILWQEPGEKFRHFLTRFIRVLKGANPNYHIIKPLDDENSTYGFFRFWKWKRGNNVKTSLTDKPFQYGFVFTYGGV